MHVSNIKNLMALPDPLNDQQSSIRPELKKRNWQLSPRKPVYIEQECFYSKAYLSLMRSSMIVLQRFLHKRTFDKRTKVYHDDPLTFISDEAEIFGISRPQFRRAISELVEKGFIVVYHQGGRHANDYSRYKLVDTWKLYGTKSFPNPKKQRCVNPGGLDAHNRKRKKSSQSCMTHYSESPTTQSESQFDLIGGS